MELRNDFPNLLSPMHVAICTYSATSTGNSTKPHHRHICSITSLTCVSVYTEVTREKLSKCDTSGPVYISGIGVFEKYFSVKVEMGQQPRALW